MRHGEAAASFVARIWLEPHQNEHSVWRGHIQHVQSGEERHFSRLTEMCAFIERMTGRDCDALWDAAPDGLGMSQ